MQDMIYIQQRGDFRPIEDLFVASFARPAHIREVELTSLTPFQRALLAIDGTVTQFIEAYMMEKIEVTRLGQKIVCLSRDSLWLNAPKGTDIVQREVLLLGKSSAAIYAYATSSIVLQRLPKDIRHGLTHDGAGLGRLVLESRLESRRDMLWYGVERPKKLPGPIRHLVGDPFLCRSYRIIAGRQPLVWINERFPVGSDKPKAKHEEEE